MAGRLGDLNLGDLVALAHAPRRSPPDDERHSTAPACPQTIGLPKAGGGGGTAVTVRAYPAPFVGKDADHMYVTYDDGRERLIARGGPSTRGATMAPAMLADALTMTGTVSPERQSLDRGAGGRLVFRGYLPNVSASEAAAPAGRHAKGVNRGGNDYGRESSSNSFAADAIEPLFGCRVGDARTWGYRTRLREDVPIPRRLNPRLMPVRPD